MVEVSTSNNAGGSATNHVGSNGNNGVGGTSASYATDGKSGAVGAAAMLAEGRQANENVNNLAAGVGTSVLATD